MCRANGEGGRRCPGCVGPTALAKHNERRRANRAIRRNVAEWARQQGDVPTEEIERLAAAPPKVAKDWIEARGHDPAEFVNGVPAPQSQAAPSAPPPAPPAVRSSPLAAAPGPGHRRGGQRARGGAPAVNPAPADQGPGWSASSWCTPELRQQILEAQAAQGIHRDERNLLGGSPEKVVDVDEGINTTQRIELDNGVVGYFKPFDGGASWAGRAFGQDSAQQSVHEVAAWRLASQMGSPWSEIVPPVVVREFDGRIGSFALERPGKIGNRAPWEGEWREAAFYDSLIGQQDRHPHNYLVAGDRITLIDHGFTFARDGDIKNHSWLVDHRRDVAPTLSYQEREVLARLTSSPDLLGLAKLLQPDRAAAMRQRAERMLATGRITSLY